MVKRFMQAGVFQPNKPDFSGLANALQNRFQGAQMGQGVQRMPHQQHMDALKEALTQANIGRTQQQMELAPLQMQLKKQQLKQQQQPKPTSLMKNIEWLKNKGMGDDEAYQMAVSHMMGPQTTIRKTNDGGFEIVQGRGISGQGSDLPSSVTRQFIKGKSSIQNLKNSLDQLKDLYPSTATLAKTAKGEAGALAQYLTGKPTGWSHLASQQKEFQSLLDSMGDKIMGAFNLPSNRLALQMSRRIVEPRLGEDPSEYERRINQFTDDLNNIKQNYQGYLDKGMNPETAVEQAAKDHGYDLSGDSQPVKSTKDPSQMTNQELLNAINQQRR